MYNYITTMFEIIIYASYIIAYLLPLIVCFVLVKNRINKTSDIYQDWYHSIKFWWAKSKVKKYQQKCANILKKESEEDMELPKKLTTFKRTDTQIIYGTDQNENMLLIKLTMRENRLAEAILELRLSNGTMYQLPEHPAVLICSIPERKWCTNDLEIDIVEPFRTLRITYNGLLRNSFSKDNEEDFVGISFSFIWSAAGRPTYFPYESHVDVLASAVANEKWKDGKWITLLESEFGYDQYGMLIGQVQRTDMPEKPLKTIRMTSCRSRFWGTSHAQALKNNVQIFAADENGLSFIIGVKSFKRRCRQLRYGTVILPNRKVCNIADSDLTPDIIKNDIYPGIISFKFKADGTTYKCRAFTHLHSASDVVNSGRPGWKCKIIKINLIINDQQAVGYITFWKDFKGQGSTLPPFLRTPFKHILNPEKKFVANIDDKESRCIALAGHLGANLALLKIVENQEFSVPAGICVLTTAFADHISNNSRLREALEDLNDISCKKVEGSLSKACLRVTNLFINESLHKDIAENILEEVSKISVNELEDSQNDTFWIVKLSCVEENSIPFVQPKKKEPPIYCKGVKNIANAITICWAEAYRYDKVKARRQNGEAIITNVAVIVQRIYPSNISGVMATINPDTGFTGETVIKANYGVDMEASDADIITIKRNLKDQMTLKAQVIGEKKHFYTMSENKIYLCKMDESVKSCICIKNDQAIKLANIGLNLTKLFGEQRFIEWALYKDQIYLTAAWPITRNTWSNFDLTHETDAAIMSKQDNVTFNRIDRVLNGAISVLSQSLYLKGFDEGLHENPNDNSSQIFDIYIRKILTSVCHHVGLNNYQISLQWSKSYVEEEDENDNIINETEELKNNYSEKYQLYQLYKKIQYYWYFNSLAKEAKSICNSFYIWQSEDSLSHYKAIDTCIPKLIRIGQLYFKVAPFQAKEIPKTQIITDSFEDIIISSTIKQIASEIHEKFNQMKEVLREKGLITKFCKVDPAEGVEWLKTNCMKVALCLEKFVNHFGYRGVKEMDLQSKTWYMNQAIIIKALQLFVHKFNEDENFELYNTTRFNLNWIFNKFFNTTPYEVSKTALAQSLHKFRMAYISLAKKLVLEGKIPDMELIFHLTHYEIGKLISHRNPALVKKAFRRSQLYPQWEKLQISKINSEMDLKNEIREEINDTRHTGYAVYPGKVVGRVCVINNMEDFYNLQYGDIVVTKFTDVGWTIFMHSLSGIVIESFDLYTEGPILASTYKIPCVIGVEGATQHFKTGDNMVLTMENYEFLGKSGIVIKVAGKENR